MYRTIFTNYVPIQITNFAGVFSETIFKIISLQKNKINILIGGIKTTISKKKFLAAPI